MKTKIIKCKDCGKEFEKSSNARFERKYCDKCSKQRKKDYGNIYKLKVDDCDEGY